jgi:PmbA protein
MNDQKDKKYEELAAEVVRIARKKGADQAEVMIETGREFNATVRMGELDVLTEAGSKAMGIRVFRGSKKFLCYTSDFELESIENFLTESLALVGITGEDEHNGLPDESELADSIPDLSLCDSEVDAIPTEKKIAMAKTAEQAAFDYDPRIQNSSGADFTDIVATTILANSHGFTGSYRDSYVGLSVSPLIDINGKKQRDFWFTRGRKASELDDPVEVGKEAARRVLRRIDARQAETREVPVVFDPRMAASFIRTLFRAMSGSMVWRKQTFLADRLGEAIGSKLVTLVDDPLRPGDLGSRPFDGEGVRSRQNLVVEEGVLKQFLTSTYSARRLGLRSTGNATRSYRSEPRVGPSNFYMLPGTSTPEEIIASVPDGLYVTRLMGFGVNYANGDFSRGAAGLWIESGKLTHAVAEITIAGNMNDMLRDVVMVGDDIHHNWSGIRCPTIKIDRMTVSGA